MREFKSFYKTVLGNEGQKCKYATRLDTYGCGCAHDCKYCYAKSLLCFRKLWDPQNPSVADIRKIENKIKTLEKGTVLRLGGMTDCFQPSEKEYKVTLKTIKLLNKYGIQYLIVTKSDLVADDEYIEAMDKNLAHIQITVTSTDDKLAATYEKATPPSKRIVAIEKLEKLGFDVQIRLSPFIPEYLDFNIINNIKCSKAIVEFLRINTFIKRTFDSIDYSKYTHKESGYYHLELDYKIALLKKITGFKQISICEDCDEAYNYWRKNVNHDKNDCCNLRKIEAVDAQKGYAAIGNESLLKQTMTAFLSSAKTNDNTANLTKKWAENQAKRGICVISGFQSAIEKQVLSVLLNNGGKAVMVLGSALFKQCPKKYKTAVSEGRLLIISYFSDEEIKTTRATAEIRNRKVLELASNIAVGCIKRGGMTEKLIYQTNKPCFVLDTLRVE